jgi:5-methylcytosine-specific restriction endonuclease McrA
MKEMLRCVVLNASFEPIHVTSAFDAAWLVHENKATVHKYHVGKYVRSIRESLQLPSAIILKRYIKIRSRNAMLTRKNLLERDRYTCQYCLRTHADFNRGEFLTRDHIVPESKGGELSWTNLVTCCNVCNNKKADKSLAESGMTLHSVPRVPTVAEVWARRYGLDY